MTHQVNRCRCGRTIHWPSGSRPGATWKCGKCGSVSRLVARGTPGADSSGKVMPSQPFKPGRTRKPVHARTRPPQCAQRHRHSAGQGSILGELAKFLLGVR